MDILYGLLAAKDLVCGTVNQLQYSFCFNDFVKELEKEEDNFIEIRRSVEDNLTHALIHRKILKADEVIDKWLENANIDAKEVNRLLEETKAKKSCCFGYCPNWIWRYRLGKKLANKTMNLQKIIQEGRQYIQLEHTASIPSNTLDILTRVNNKHFAFGELITKKYMNFDSRKFAYDELMRALRDDGVAIIGLYGMGGCGKTTLAREIIKMVQVEHLFDTIVYLPLPSPVEVPRIQEAIASILGYRFLGNEEIERAQRLCKRLTYENFLLILDDVWEKLDFGRIGIPSYEHRKACKILIISQSEEVCTLMDCQRKIYLPILNDEEAWTLFQIEAHIFKEIAQIIKPSAILISNECKGLPIAIAGVARNLKDKPEEIWSDTLNTLRSSEPINGENGLQDLYECVQLSYDHLDTKEAKSLFLMCSAFPKDYKISVECLIRCAIGLGVAGEVDSYEKARRKVIAAKIKLVSSCLMLDAYDESVKMHDLVRNAAHSIAKNENKIIKCETKNDVTLEESPIRYLWCVKFPEDMDCSNLEFLSIEAKLEVSDRIFRSMRKLRVLIITNRSKDYGLPFSIMSLKTLTNLRYLVLQYWKLSDISFIIYMNKLQSLSLHRCTCSSFLDLQIGVEFTPLENLRLLEFNKCDIEKKIFEEIKRIPLLEFEEIERISLLEELYIIARGPEYNDEKIEKGMNELNELEIPDFEEIECLVESRNHLSKMENVFSKLHLLSIQNMKHLRTLWHGYLLTNEHFEKLEKLYLRNCPQLKSLFTYVIAGGLVLLKILHIVNCNILEHIVANDNILEHIVANDEDELTIGVQSKIFQNLEEVVIHGCGKLKHIFSASIIGGLSQLKSIKITHCEMLEQIIVNHSSGSFSLWRLEMLRIVCCPRLGSVFPTSVAKTMTSLKKLIIEDCHDLKHILTHDFQTHPLIILLYVKMLTIRECELLQHIIPESLIIEEYPFHLKETNMYSSTLEVLELLDLPNLVSICDTNSPSISALQDDAPGIQNHFLTLQTLSVKKVNVKDVFSLNGPKLKLRIEDLHLINLRQITHITFVTNNCFIQHLKSIQIVGCEKLEAIFPQSACLPELISLEVRECKELMMIVYEDFEENKLCNLSSQPCFPKLAKLVVEECHKLTCFVSQCASASEYLPNLEIIVINGANEFEKFIGYEIENIKLPELKLVIFMHLPKFQQETNFLYVKHRIVDNCPKLSLTSTTTLKEIQQKFAYEDFKNSRISLRELISVIDNIKE